MKLSLSQLHVLYATRALGPEARLRSVLETINPTMGLTEESQVKRAIGQLLNSGLLRREYAKASDPRPQILTLPEDVSRVLFAEDRTLQRLSKLMHTNFPEEALPFNFRPHMEVRETLTHRFGGQNHMVSQEEIAG